MTKQEFKQKCSELRGQDYTLSEMVRVLKRPKTTIFFHIQNVPISDKLKQKLRDINRTKLDKARAMGLTTKKGVSWKNRHCKEFTKWSPALVNLIAHAMFDGEISYSRVAYHNRSVALIKNFSDKMRLVYSYKPKVYKKGDGVITLGYHNVELADLFNKKRNELLTGIKILSRESKLEFLRAFFDDEGAVEFKNKKRLVRGYQHNNRILFIVKELLSEINIESKVDKKYFEIIISRKENLIKFQKLINFSPGVRVNGQRSNSIWKESLEKREILNRAINSYLN